MYTYSQRLDIIFALNEDTINLHKSDLKDGGVIICDDGIAEDKSIMHLPLMEASKEIQDKRVFTTTGLGEL